MALRREITASFASGGGQSDAIEYHGKMALIVSNCPSGATVTIQHSADGSNWYSRSRDEAGNVAALTAACVVFFDVPIHGVMTRASVTGTFTGTCSLALGY